MAVKIDKEVLIKHHFWILTGLCVILVLIPILCLWFGVNDTVAAEEKKLTEAKNKAKGITNPKNEKHVEAYKKQDGYVEKKQTEVWKQASETQMDLMTWPEALVNQFPSFKTKYFGDPIEQFADNLYAQEYATQLPAVLAIVQPLVPNVNLQGVDK